MPFIEIKVFEGEFSEDEKKKILKLLLMLWSRFR